MLKYNINIKKTNNDRFKLNVEKWSTIDVYTKEEDRIINTLKCKNIYDLHKGDKLNMNCLINLSSNILYEYNTSYEIYSISEVENDYINIVFFSKKFMSLPVINFIKNENSQWYFYFKNKHLFNENDNIVLYIRYIDNNGNLIYKKIDEVKIITDEVLRWNIVEDEEISYINNYILTKNVNNVGFDILREDLCKTLTYNSDTQGLDNTTFTIDNDVAEINLNLTSSFQTDLLTQHNLEEYFVQEEIDKSIPDFIDMEKNVYQPVCKMSNGEFKDVYKIKFNLHFRQHRGEDWTVEDNVYWNGVNNDTITIDRNYFSYDNGEEEYQSDLLYFLNYSDSDVKYQKNSYKKSFLRLSYYDSDNPTNQLLLGYSTVFIDSSGSFNKYMKNLKTEPFIMLSIDDNNELVIKDGLIGSRVNREPYSSLINNKNKDEIEEYRLSSQFIVNDRYSSINSSEGFYIYLWKNMDTGVIPSDLYLHIDFNHAGLGRTIPFMLPFFGTEKFEEWDRLQGVYGIKNFEDILTDWKNGGYNLRRYNKYSYIHLKYEYNKTLKRYIYYLDPETYGDVYTFDDKTNTLYINIYEAKISNGSIDDNIKTITNFSNPTIELSYDDISGQGGSVYPNIRYSQIVTYSDGSTAEFTSGGQVTYNYSLDGLGYEVYNTLPNTGIDGQKYLIVTDNSSVVNITEYLYDSSTREVWIKKNVLTFSKNNGRVSSGIYQGEGNNKNLINVTVNLSMNGKNASDGPVTVIQTPTEKTEINSFYELELDVIGNPIPNTGGTITILPKIYEIIVYSDNSQIRNIKWDNVNSINQNATIDGKLNFIFILDNTAYETPNNIKEYSENDSEYEILGNVNVSVIIDGEIPTKLEKTIEFSQLGTKLGNEYIFETDKNTTFEFEKEGGEVLLYFNSYINTDKWDFNIENDNNWVNVIKQNNSINGYNSCVKIVCLNNEDLERSGVIKLIQHDSLKEITINITQKENIKNYVFTFEDSEIEYYLSVPYNSASHIINIISTCNNEPISFNANIVDSEIINTYNISTSTSGIYMFEFKVNQNNTTQNREEIITFTQEESGNIIKLTLKQFGDNVILIPSFDYLVTRYYWHETDGRDLDTMTVIKGTTGLTWNEQPLDYYYVGFNGHSMGSDLSSIYLMHGGDNRESGNEACVILYSNLCSVDNLKILKDNNVNEFYVDIYANWWGERKNGLCSVELIAYKGGSIKQDGYNFINEGGVVVYNDRLDGVNVTSSGTMIAGETYDEKYTYIAQITYNIRDKSASLNLIDNN